jgi:tetratricopeptide (TPR) repeat protein
LEKALEISPTITRRTCINSLCNNTYGALHSYVLNVSVVLYAMKRYDEALVEAKKALELNE